MKEAKNGLLGKKALERGKEISAMGRRPTNEMIAGDDVGTPRRRLNGCARARTSRGFEWVVLKEDATVRQERVSIGIKGRGSSIEIDV